MQGIFLFTYRGILLIFLECCVENFVYHQFLGQHGGNFSSLLLSEIWEMLKLEHLQAMFKTKFLFEFKASDTSLFCLWEIKIFIKATNQKNKLI